MRDIGQPDDVQEAVRREAASLWHAVFGEPPAGDADGAEMLEVIIRHLETKDYARLYAADRAPDIVWPRYKKASKPVVVSF
jgi:hypothetical protein